VSARRARLGLVAGVLGLAACSASAPPPPLVLLITVDTLRADRLGAYGSKLDATPHLDRLAAESQLFEIAYAPTPFTLASIASLLTGELPEKIGVLNNRAKLGDDIPTLATEFQAAGFATGAVVSSHVLRRASGLARGFDVFDDTTPVTQHYMPERVGPETTEAALGALDQLLAEQPAPAFLWIHYQDPHGPYTPPPELLERYRAQEQVAGDGARTLPVSPMDRGWGAIPRYQVLGEHRDAAFYRASYHAEIAYLDTAIGALLDGLSERGLRDKAVIVFTADHGESLGEDDYWFAHGEHLSDAQLRIPLIVRVPGLAAERRRDNASLLDVAPTLEGLVGIAPPPDAPGRDLIQQREPAPLLVASLSNAAATRVGLVAEGTKYMLSFGRGPREERLLELRADYAEVPVIDPDRLVAMRRRLAAERSALAAVARPELRQTLSEDDQRKLEALGYVETDEVPPPPR
jgi:arylsulfatase